MEVGEDQEVELVEEDEAEKVEAPEEPESSDEGPKYIHISRVGKGDILVEMVGMWSAQELVSLRRRLSTTRRQKLKEIREAKDGRS